MEKMTVEFRAVNNPTTWRRDKFDLKFARTLGKDAIYSEKRRFRPFFVALASLAAGNLDSSI